MNKWATLMLACGFAAAAVLGGLIMNFQLGHFAHSQCFAEAVHNSSCTSQSGPEFLKYHLGALQFFSTANLVAAAALLAFFFIMFRRLGAAYDSFVLPSFIKKFERTAIINRRKFNRWLLVFAFRLPEIK